MAAEYDRRRPTYPDELVDHACQVAEIGSGDRVLEVGCGSGQLTRSLVARGLHVTALEPGPRLRSLAEQNLGGRGEVEFVNARFEDARLPRARFRAVFSASAFHWIDPEVSWRQAADALVPGGTLALIQYFGLESSAASATSKRFYRAWQRSHRRLPQMLMQQTADELNALLRTASFYHRMSPSQRHAVESEHLAMYERLGRPIRSSTVAVLVTARREPALHVSG